ncbi:MAG: FTR1 family protein [Solirubrobacterales bacterium]
MFPFSSKTSTREAQSLDDRERFCDQATGRRWKLPLSSRITWYVLAFGFISGLVYLMATASTGPMDPSEATRGSMSHGTAVFNSSMIVFREGLEAVLILAAITASFRGANLTFRRPVFLGAVAAFAASVLTWLIAGEVLQQFSGLGMRLEAITGFLAVIVLLIVLNWFVHKVYWSGWIAKHNRRRRELMGGAGAGVLVGLVALGFTSVYREGFETVLFLQNLRVTVGSSVVLEGVAIGLALTAVVGSFVFVLHRKLPYKKMLIATGIMIGFVLVVMVGGTAATFQDLGWLPTHDLPAGIVPIWMGAWFEIYPTWETIGAQVLAAAFVIGSYYAAEYMNVRRPARRGQPVARPAEVPPATQPSQPLT